MFSHKWNVYIASTLPRLGNKGGLFVRAVVGIDQTETMSSGHSMVATLINSQLLWLMIKLVIIPTWRGRGHGSSALPGKLLTVHGF